MNAERGSYTHLGHLRSERQGRFEASGTFCVTGEAAASTIPEPRR